MPVSKHAPKPGPRWQTIARIVAAGAPTRQSNRTMCTRSGFQDRAISRVLRRSPAQVSCAGLPAILVHTAAAETKQTVILAC